MVSKFLARLFLSGLCLPGLFLLSACSKPLQTSEQDAAPKHIPRHLDKIPDATPRVEPLSKYGNRFKNSNSYVALKRRYTVMPTSKGYRAQGQASWYGTKFQGRRTSSGEPYDMFSMTAAHRTLPLPTYARVTNVDNGKSVIVKINDRGPFHKNRLIDLSYVAAHKLGILGKGTGHVTVESIDPRDHHGKIPKQRSNLFAKNSRSFRNASQATHPDLQTPVHQHPQNAGSKLYPNAPLALRAKETKKSRTEKKLYLQMGAFSQKSHAENLMNELSAFSQYGTSIANDAGHQKSLFKVRLGPFDNQQQLQQATQAIVQAKYPQPLAVKE